MDNSRKECNVFMYCRVDILCMQNIEHRTRTCHADVLALTPLVEKDALEVHLENKKV